MDTIQKFYPKTGQVVHAIKSSNHLLPLPIFNVRF
jgi:hypothetical protein